MKRVFGLETEYGITVTGTDVVDVVAESIELVRRYTDHGAHMKWDYELEDPHLDARGFRAPIHGIDAHNHAEKIGPLRNLKYSGLTGGAFCFHSHFAGAGEDLAGDKERQHACHNAIPWQFARDQIVIVAAVTVTHEIGVVFVKPHLLLGW